MRKRRCWYCRRVGWLGWKQNHKPWKADECRDDASCFSRARARGVRAER